MIIFGIFRFCIAFNKSKNGVELDSKIRDNTHVDILINIKPDVVKSLEKYNDMAANKIKGKAMKYLFKK